MIPGLDGIGVCRRIRAHSGIPVLLLSDYDDEEHRVEGLEAGADDYVVKPFSYRELMARITVVVRRARGLAEVKRRRLRRNREALRRGVPRSLRQHHWDRDGRADAPHLRHQMSSPENTRGKSSRFISSVP